VNDERPEAFMMIGLHKLAAQNGDGLVPELYALLTRRAQMLEDNPNVSEFPVHEARMRARVMPYDAAAALESHGDNVVAFPKPVMPVVRRRDTV
jgi:hypothetical protein